jgi:hypothetical protein
VTLNTGRLPCRGVTNRVWSAAARDRRDRPEAEDSQTPARTARLGVGHKAGADVTNANATPPNGIELRRNTRKPNRRRAQRAKVKAAGVVACSELFGGGQNRPLAPPGLYSTPGSEVDRASVSAAPAPTLSSASR